MSTPPHGRTISIPKPLSCSARMHLPHDTAYFATTPTFLHPKESFRESHFWRCNACVGSLPVRDEFDPLQKTSQRFASRVGINTFAMSRLRWNALCLQVQMQINQRITCSITIPWWPCDHWWDRDSNASSRRWVGSMRRTTPTCQPETGRLHCRTLSLALSV